MSFRIVPLEAWHLDAIELQPAQRNLQGVLRTAEYREALLCCPVAFTAIDEDEKVVGSAGLIPIWPGREIAWTLLSDCGPVQFVNVHRAVKALLDGREMRRIEMTVDAHHASAHRWARLLGFRKEGRMRAFTPDGRDADLYARVQDGGN